MHGYWAGARAAQVYVSYCTKLIDRHSPITHTLPPQLAFLVSAYLSSLSYHRDIAEKLHKRVQTLGAGREGQG